MLTAKAYITSQILITVYTYSELTQYASIQLCEITPCVQNRLKYIKLYLNHNIMPQAKFKEVEMMLHFIIYRLDAKMI